MGWGGVGWDNNAHVPARTQAPQPHHLFCCPADTSTSLSDRDISAISFATVTCAHKHHMVVGAVDEIMMMIMMVMMMMVMMMTMAMTMMVMLMVVLRMRS